MKALTYDDVLIRPQVSEISSRSEVDLSQKVTPNVELDVPIISAPMDTVTEGEMAIAMSRNGALGMIHRYMDPEEQAEEVETASSSSPIAATVGLSDTYERVDLLEEAGADIICLDVAHGGMTDVAKALDTISSMGLQADIMAGNVATRRTAEMLFIHGADAVKVGVGPGAACTTREKTGVGVPQITAISSCNSAKPSDGIIIADGGMKNPGDVAKALFAGADGAMLGSFFANCYSSAGETGHIRGMASKEAKEDYDSVDNEYREGGTKTISGEGETVKAKINEIKNGLRSACSYVGERTLDEARKESEFVEVTENAVVRNGVH